MVGQSKGNGKDYCLDLFHPQKTDTNGLRASSAKGERKIGDATGSVLYRATRKRMRLHLEKTKRISFEKVRSRIRSRIPHFEENEPNISYYARMVKIKSEGNTIQSLYDQNGIRQWETSQILKITENYHSDLLRQEKQISNINQKY